MQRTHQDTGRGGISTTGGETEIRVAGYLTCFLNKAPRRSRPV